MKFFNKNKPSSSLSEVIDLHLKELLVIVPVELRIEILSYLTGDKKYYIGRLKNLLSSENDIEFANLMQSYHNFLGLRYLCKDANQMISSMNTQIQPWIVTRKILNKNLVEDLKRLSVYLEDRITHANKIYDEQQSRRILRTLTCIVMVGFLCLLPTINIPAIFIFYRVLQNLFDSSQPESFLQKFLITLGMVGVLGILGFASKKVIQITYNSYADSPYILDRLAEQNKIISFAAKEELPKLFTHYSLNFQVIKDYLWCLSLEAQKIFLNNFKEAFEFALTQIGYRDELIIQEIISGILNVIQKQKSSIATNYFRSNFTVFGRTSEAEQENDEVMIPMEYLLVEGNGSDIHSKKNN